MNTVWIVTYEDVGADGGAENPSIVGVYADFEDASRHALKAAHEQVQDYKTHTEATVHINLSTSDGLAYYTVLGHYGENPDYPWDIYEIRRHEVK